MEILVVAGELAPFVVDTAAGDSVASLTKTLRQAGHGVTAVVPHSVAFAEQGLLVARRLTPLVLPDGTEVTVFESQLASGARLYLFDDGAEHTSDVRRYGLVCRAAVALAREQERMGNGFDVAHLHDWPAALAAVELAHEPELALATVLTIHDGARQGLVPTRELSEFGPPFDPDEWDYASSDDTVSLLAAGVQYADAITTVSARYAEELRDEGQFGAVAAAIAACDKPVVGIENGIDYALFNPATDPALPSHYSAEDVANKGRCKTALVRQLELELELDRPLIGVRGELSAEAGFDLLLEALPRLLKGNVTVVISGEAQGALRDDLLALRRRYPDKLGQIEAPTEADLRRVVAAADLVICPARHQACSSAPRIAQRYGAVPVARASGGTLDMVVDCDAALETGTGFLYTDATASELLKAVQRGLSATVSPAWAALRRRVMRLDVGWDRPARRYLQVYQEAVRSRS